jgi:hypothetical protein
MQITYEKDEIVIRVPFNAKSAASLPLTASKKNHAVASTGGFIPVPGAPDGTRINLNVICKKKDD